MAVLKSDLITQRIFMCLANIFSVFDLDQDQDLVPMCRMNADQCSSEEDACTMQWTILTILSFKFMPFLNST